MMTSKQFICIFVLITLSFISTWAVLHIKNNNLPVISDPDYPDGFLENVQTLQTDNNGNPSLLFETPRISHYTSGNANFDSPVITLYNDNAPWIIHANHGQTKEHTDKIFLWGEVNIHRASRATDKEITITTPALTYIPSKKIIETSQAVSIFQPPLNKITAVGARVNIVSHIIDLLANVRGNYVAHENSAIAQS